MTETNNLKLSLPGSSDYVDVNVLNENFKKIDAKAVHASSHSTGGNDPISPESIGAASASHSHAQSDIEGLEEALSNISASDHKHSASDITSGTLSTARLPTVPITKGGTGATDVANARKNLGAAASDHTHTPESIGAATETHVHEWGDITGRPNSFTPASHSHSASDISNGTLPVTRGGTGQTTITPAVTTKALRSSYGGTADMTASSTSLTTGQVYLQYE